MALGIPMAWHEHFFSPLAPMHGVDEDDEVSGRFDACETEDGRFLVYSAEHDKIVISGLPSRIAAVASAARLANVYQPTKSSVTVTVPLVGLSLRQVEALISDTDFLIDAVELALQRRFNGGRVNEDELWIQSHFSQHDELYAEVLGSSD